MPTPDKNADLRDALRKAFGDLSPIKANDTAETLIRKFADECMVVVDEYENFAGIRLVGEKIRVSPSLGPELVLEDPRFPAARVEVWAGHCQKNDPQHPNPDMGPIRSYGVFVPEAEKWSRHIFNWAIAEAKAKSMHKAIVKRLLAEQVANQPTFGMF
jgi:hypothetical protein